MSGQAGPAMASTQPWIRDAQTSVFELPDVNLPDAP